MTTREKPMKAKHYDMPRIQGSIAYGYPDRWIDPHEVANTSERLGTILIENKTSLSTPGWNKISKQIYFVPVLRKKAAPKPPVAPIYRPPKLLRPLDLKRKATPQQRTKALRKWHVRYKQSLERKRQYDLIFAKRVDRYNRKKLHFDTVSQAPRYRKTKRVRKITSRQAVNNPYFMVRISNTGFSGTYEDRQRCTLVNYGNLPGQSYMVLNDGPSTYSVRAFGGYFGDSFYGEFDMITPQIGLNFPSYGPLTSLIAKSDDKAVKKLYSSLNDQEVHVANVIGERHQMIDLFISKATALANFIRKPLHEFNKFIESGKLAKNVANNHLVYCFGVEPLVSDVHGAAVKLAKLMHDKPSDYLDVHASGTMTDRTIKAIEYGAFTDYHQVDVMVTTRYVLKYHIDNPGLGHLQSLGLVNPLEVAWELTPWSFVIDWFLPIGAYLTSLTADAGLSFVSGTKSITTKVTSTSRRVYNGPVTGAPGRTVYGSIEGSRTVETKDRTVLSAAPVSRLPSFKNPFSARHLGLAIALFTQRLR